MPSGSDNKEAACEFIKWATSKEIVLKTQVDGAVPMRASLCGPTSTTASDWVEAVAASASGAAT